MDVQLKVMQWFWFTPDRLADEYGDDRVFDDKYTPLWTAFEWIQDKTAKTLCRIYGHLPERDQCNRPEHDFCLYCHKLMPNSWTPDASSEI